MTVLKIDAPAKVNLHLQVVGRRTDGFHELRTLFQSIDLCDRLQAVAAPEGVLELQVDPDTLELAGEQNLVLRAARALWRWSGRSPGASILLQKNIPIGGGLGGGSSDAAAALVLLNQLWNLNLGMNELFDIAAELGSDVPFFLIGGLALGVGRGEEVFPLGDLEPYGMMVLMPPVEVSTAEVFGRVRLGGGWGRMAGSVYASMVGKETAIEWAGMVNDLEPIVCDGWPLVSEALESVRRLGPLRAAVTGSGASVFGVFPSVDHAREASARLETPFRFEVCRMLTRAEARKVFRGAEFADKSVGEAAVEKKLEVVRGDN